MVISDRKVRSADVGVSGIYEVISEADLAFSPDSRAEAVTVFQVNKMYLIYESRLYPVYMNQLLISAAFWVTQKKKLIIFKNLIKNQALITLYNN